MSVESDGPHVRVQEARKEANQEAKGRADGTQREAHFAKSQLAIRGQSGVRVRGQGLALSHTHAHERWRSQVSHSPHAGRVQRGPRALLHRRDRVRPRALARQPHRLPRPQAREHSARRRRSHSHLRSGPRGRAQRRRLGARSSGHHRLHG